MIYLYQCNGCANSFEIIKSVKEIDEPEYCDRCASEATRLISKVNLVAINDWVESYNPGLGQVVKNKAHQREILRRYRDNGKELIEVGNEPVGNIHKQCDNIRQEKQKKRWDEPAEKILQEIR